MDKEAQRMNSIASKVRILSDFIFSGTDLFVKLRVLLDDPSIHCLQWSDDGKSIFIMRNHLNELDSMLCINNSDRIIQWLANKLLPFGFKQLLKESRDGYIVVGFFHCQFAAQSSHLLVPHPFSYVPTASTQMTLPQHQQQLNQSYYERPRLMNPLISTNYQQPQPGSYCSTPVMNQQVMPAMLRTPLNPHQPYPPPVLPYQNPPHYVIQGSYCAPVCPSLPVPASQVNMRMEVTDISNKAQCVSLKFKQNGKQVKAKSKTKKTRAKKCETGKEASGWDEGRHAVGQSETKITQSNREHQQQSSGGEEQRVDGESEDQCGKQQRNTNTKSNKQDKNGDAESRPSKKEKLAKYHTMLLVNNPSVVKMFGNAYLKWKELKKKQLASLESATTNIKKCDYSALYDQKTIDDILKSSRSQESIDLACQSILIK